MKEKLQLFKSSGKLSKGGRSQMRGYPLKPSTANKKPRIWKKKIWKNRVKIEYTDNL